MNEQTEKEKQHHRNECHMCSHAVSILAGMCYADHDAIVDVLTGQLWDEEEAGMIKECRKAKK